MKHHKLMEGPLPPIAQGRITKIILALIITHAPLQQMKIDLTKLNLLASNEKQSQEAYHFYHNLMVPKVIYLAKLTLEKVLQNISTLLQT